MTENLKIALEAVNKWLYYGWNYDLVPFSWTNSDNEIKSEYLPEFLVNVKWTCNIHHIKEKWHKAVKSQNTDAYLVSFYAELDSPNRILLLEYVMQHYNGEQHLNFHDDE